MQKQPARGSWFPSSTSEGCLKQAHASGPEGYDRSASKDAAVCIRGQKRGGASRETENRQTGRQTDRQTDRPFGARCGFECGSAADDL